MQNVLMLELILKRLEIKKIRNKICANLRHEYIEAKSCYNRLKRKHKTKFNIKEKEILANLSKSKPKEFWNKIKSQYKKVNPNLRI